MLFRKPRGPCPVYAAAELLVLAKIELRRSKKLRVTGKLIRYWMRQCVKAENPGTSFVANQTFLMRFVNRHGLTVHRKTNQKTKSVMTKLILMKT